MHGGLPACTVQEHSPAVSPGQRLAAATPPFLPATPGLGRASCGGRGSAAAGGKRLGLFYHPRPPAACWPGRGCTATACSAPCLQPQLEATNIWPPAAEQPPGGTLPPEPPARTRPPWALRCPLGIKVKFMREVTPYIKKPSLVSDLPWEGAAPQSPSLSGSEDSGSPKHHGARDRKVIPLKMCFAARNLSMPDLENRLIELHSPDSRNTLILRCKDTATAHSWFTALHANITALLPQVLAELNATLGGGAGGREVKHIAWLAEQARLDGGRQQWRPVLMAVTEKDLLLYDAMPWTRDAWASPCHSYPLVATRLVHSGSGRRSPSLGSDLTFATRTGSRQGIEMHVFRVETHRDLSCWTRVLVQGCHAAAELIKEVSVGCTLGGQEVKLCIHYEGGFTVCREEGGGSVLFRYPYEKLKMSADDGIRTLYLDFGGPEGELALDLHSCPKPIVFILHTFLSAKVTRMGLLV
uniref:PH domain-containing protein n=1 Tax=Anas platyrhynchos platyrhynchos TaxID=8840 RepID=A0A493TF65_ANAPP